MAEPWDAEVEVTEALARRLVRGQFPLLAGERFEPVGSGWDNDVWRVDGEWAFRFPRRKLGGLLMETELAVLPRIADRLPIGIPVARFVGRPAGDYPWPFAGARHLPGRPVPEASLGERERTALAGSLGRFLRALHDVPAEDLADTGITRDRLGRMDLARHLPKGLELLDRAIARRWLPGSEPWRSLASDCARGGRPVRLVHGDLYAAHLLVDDAGRPTGVIDWGNIHLGDPAMDLMPVYAIFPAAARAAFLAAYGGIDAETERLARSRGVLHALWVLRYAAETGRDRLFEETRAGLHRLAVWA